MKKLIIGIVLFWSPLLVTAQTRDGVTYCHKQTVIAFQFDRSNGNNDVFLSVDGKSQKLMTAYSWFGSAQQAPKGFKFAILGEGKFDPLLVFDDYLMDAANNRYVKCTQKLN